MILRLIDLPIAILYFSARKITAEGAEERRVFNPLFPLRVPLRTLRLNSLFGHGMLPVCENMPDIGKGIKDPGMISFCKNPLELLEYLVRPLTSTSQHQPVRNTR